ncbi:FtsH protease activity modulator HflK [Lachnospiraceae bacterium C1.1]|nr:FtsH protease activity modulator HflK [Lachnospiraceae bacterium C1.1]
MSFFKKNQNNTYDNTVNMEPKKSPMRIVKIIVIVFIVLFLATSFNSCFYSVGEQEQAVLTQFGQVQSVKSAGLYFKLPFIQRVHKISTTTVGMPVGYMPSTIDGESNPGAASSTTDSLMITSDFNFINIDFYLEYRVSDPVKYLYNANNPEAIVENEAMAAIRSTVSDYTVDDAITTGKSQIQSAVKERLVEELTEDDIGIEVVNITVQDSEPPTDEVRSAFKSVENAKQGADTAVNNAKAYQSEKIPAAEAAADKIVQDATAQKETRISEAAGQVERFNKTYAEYQKYPLITKQRMFYETVENLLPGVKLYIDDGGTSKLLPLGDFNSAAAAASSVTVSGNNAE